MGVIVLNTYTSQDEMRKRNSRVASIIDANNGHESVYDKFVTHQEEPK